MTTQRKKINVLQRARQVIDIEARAVKALRGRIGGAFRDALYLLLATKGRVVVSGMGKTGIIGQKLSATLASTGTPSLFLHLAEAIHGDLGRVTAADTVVVLSNSGTSVEIRQLLPLLKKIGTKIIALTGNRTSVLAEHSDVVLDVSVEKEACPLGLAPTASTTATLAMADALAVCLLELRGFKEHDFAFYHPGGALGRRLLLTVKDIMRTGSSHAVVKENTLVSAVLMAVTEARAGSASVVDARGRLSGIFTDGDLRRHLEEDPNLAVRRVRDVMTKSPVRVVAHMLAAEALRILKEKKIDEVPVVDDRDVPIGLLDVQDLLRAGVV